MLIIFLAVAVVITSSNMVSGNRSGMTSEDERSANGVESEKKLSKKELNKLAKQQKKMEKKAEVQYLTSSFTSFFIRYYANVKYNFVNSVSLACSCMCRRK